MMCSVETRVEGQWDAVHGLGAQSTKARIIEEWCAV